MAWLMRGEVKKIKQCVFLFVYKFPSRLLNEVVLVEEILIMFGLLALCARMAHQSDSLATLLHSGAPSVLLGANVRDGILLVTFLLLLKEK